MNITFIVNMLYCCLCIFGGYIHEKAGHSVNENHDEQAPNDDSGNIATCKGMYTYIN